MIKTMYLSMLMGVVLAGCGGGGTTATATSQTTPTTAIETASTTSREITPTITSNFKIDITKIDGYESTDPIEDQYLAVINYLRSLSIKCNDPYARSGPVDSDMQWDDLLAASAEEHSEDMRIAEHYSHLGSDTASDITGQTFTPTRASKFNERIAYNGYIGSSAENIAVYGSSPEAANSDKWITIMEAWMTSTTGHCSNIMNPNLTDFGMFESRADVNGTGWYKVYWTQNFGGQ